MNEPLVTVIVSAYNHEDYVEEAILSIIDQTYENIELLVFDDGSTDDTPEILERLSKKHEFYFERQKNIGLPATRNKGIHMAKGEYIGGIASDDAMLPTRIETLMNKMQELGNGYGLVCGDVGLIDLAGKRTMWNIGGNQFKTFMGYYFDRRKDVNDSNFGSYETFLKGNYIPAAGVLIRRSDLIRAGLYDENILIEDWDMLLKLSRHGTKMHFIRDEVSLYRWHDSNTVKVRRKKIQLDACKILFRELVLCALKLRIYQVYIISVRLMFTIGTVVVPKWLRKLVGLHSLVD